MRIRKFRAATPTEAMDQVRAEMGEDAIILSTRLVQGAGEVHGGRVEMTAAVDWDRLEKETASASAPYRRVSPGGINHLEASAVPAKPAPGLRRDSADWTVVEARLEALQGLMQRMSSQVRVHVPAPDELALDDLYRTVYAEMVANEVEPNLALRVIQSVKSRVHPDTGRMPVSQAVQGALKTLLPAPRAKARRIQALVGPTGVGKTTTAAKLASREILEGQSPVVLVSCDTYRVAAVTQLRSYADAMGARFEVAHDVQGLDQILSRNRRAKRIVVDTEGRGQRDLRALEPLFSYLRSHDEIDRHLVLAATTKPRDLDESVDRFASAIPDQLVFTKVDETNSYGPILSESVRSGLPVSYLGTGQRVPEELLLATPQKLAELAVSSIG